MVSVGKQIQLLRKEKGMNQGQLAEAIGVSLTQLQRYENKGVQPPADILRKLADTFNTSIDFLVYGDAEQKARQAIKDNELLAQFKAVEEMDTKDKSTIKDIIDAYIKRSRLSKIAAL
ncbi:MAG: helix-turn-helix domain-containing protein [Bacteroidetes bacterium]|jgi:transcriptional regulator with XRE-family HTH domain|nr:helix-turn-helix domain-containing protein [Bacteroidota bacterium]